MSFFQYLKMARYSQKYIGFQIIKINMKCSRSAIIYRRTVYES